MSNSSNSMAFLRTFPVSAYVGSSNNLKDQKVLWRNLSNKSRNARVIDSGLVGRKVFFIHHIRPAVSPSPVTDLTTGEGGIWEILHARTPERPGVQGYLAHKKTHPPRTLP